MQEELSITLVGDCSQESSTLTVRIKTLRAISEKGLVMVKVCNEKYLYYGAIAVDSIIFKSSSQEFNNSCKNLRFSKNL